MNGDTIRANAVRDMAGIEAWGRGSIDTAVLRIAVAILVGTVVVIVAATSAVIGLAGLLVYRSWRK
jgi:hypothetical protein